MHPLIKYRLTAVLILMVFFALGVDTITHKNPTADEPVHLTRGITLWQTADFRFQQEHTPLAHWLIGSIAHLPSTIPAVTKLPGWITGERLPASRALVWESGLNVEALFLAGRLPILLLATIAVAVVMRWADDLSGHMAALLAGVLIALDPNFLAHASLATTDATAAVGYLLALFAVWRYGKKPTPLPLLVAGLALGIGIAAKMTGALLVPVVILIVWFDGHDRPWSARLKTMVFLLATAGLVVWSSYRLSWGAVPLTSEGLTLSLPAPAYWRSLIGVNNHVTGGHQAFFLGEIGSDGWLSYFPVAFLLKTPLLTLLLWVAAVWLSFRQRAWRSTIYFWVPASLIFSLAMIARLNIGYRHILPLVPLLIVWTAAAVAPHLATLKTGRWLFSTGVVAFILMQLWIHPHHLAFFNPLAGGPALGYRYLGDSNLDWGQDWQTAAGRIAVNPDLPTQVLTFGFIDLAYYDLADRSILDSQGAVRPSFAPANPAPGDYYLSVNGLQGLLAEPDLLDYFRRLEPIQKRETGYSIFVYRVTEAKTGRWIAYCTAPAALLTENDAERWLGVAEVRHVYFDCRRSWVFPQDGQPGWVIVPRDHPLPDQGLDTIFGDALQRVYSHRPTTAAPAFDVYYWSGTTDPADWLLPVDPPEESILLQPLGGQPLSASSWVTGWRVIQPTAQPLSIFAHLYTTASTPAAVDDGLGYPVDQWRPGDLFLQFHRFDTADPPQYLQTGPYNFATGDRVDLAIDIPFELKEAKR